MLAQDSAAIGLTTKPSDSLAVHCHVIHVSNHGEASAVWTGTLHLTMDAASLGHEKKASVY